MQNFNIRLEEVCCRLKNAVKNHGLCICTVCLIICAAILFVNMNMKTVYIKDGDETILSQTLRKDPNEILSEQGIKIMAFDVVDFTGFEGKLGVININRAFPVTFTCDGKTQKVMTPEVSVREFLDNQDVTLNLQDTVNIPKAFYLSEGDNLVVTRVESETGLEVSPIPFEIDYIQTPLLKEGRQRVLYPGREGEKHSIIKRTFENGKEKDTEILEETIVKEAYPARVLVGANVPASPMDFGIELDANGNPVHYKKVLRNQHCTGYNAFRGAKGASGMRLEAGCVAVRSNQIPYGTKLYIKSADGSFVYGCAVAADTGLGLMQNVIDIDLYYDSYSESCLNGRRVLDVYIL